MTGPTETKKDKRDTTKRVNEHFSSPAKGTERQRDRGGDEDE